MYFALCYTKLAMYYGKEMRNKQLQFWYCKQNWNPDNGNVLKNISIDQYHLFFSVVGFKPRNSLTLARQAVYYFGCTHSSYIFYFIYFFVFEIGFTNFFQVGFSSAVGWQVFSTTPAWSGQLWSLYLHPKSGKRRVSGY